MKKHKEIADNIFSNAQMMLLNSVGRLPTSLVLILLLSTAMAALTGLVMVINKPAPKSDQFLEQRLEVSENAVSLDPKDIQGTWIYQTPEYAMSLTFIDDRFEWIVLFGDIPEAQYYARGNYRIVGDVMIFGVRPDLGKPYDTTKPWMKYMPISMKNMNTKFVFDKKSLQWQIPSSEQKKIIAQVSRIFANNTSGTFKWVRG